VNRTVELVFGTFTALGELPKGENRTTFDFVP